MTHLAALRCIISSDCLCLEMCGSETVAAYSMCGRTSVLNSFSFVELDRILMFLLPNASCWFALALILSTCFPQVRSFARVTPRYFVFSVDLRFVPCRGSQKRLGDLDRVTLITLHFCGWNSMLYSASHRGNLWRSCCRMARSAALLI